LWNWCGVALLVGCSIAFIQNDKTLSSETILKRLIAYTGYNLVIPWNGAESKFHGCNITVQNVSGDTITARLMFLNVDIDGTKVLVIPPGNQVIIQQTTGTIFQTWRDDPEDAHIPLDAKAITMEFEFNYDTIPEGGLRRSYRKIAYSLNWANGKNSAPLLEPHIVEEWER
jgi:hypothetical protein